MSLNTIRTGFYNNSDGAKATLLCRSISVYFYIKEAVNENIFLFYFQNDFLYFFDLSCLFDDTWPLTSVFLATFSRCKEDNEDRRRHNMTSLVINYNNKTSYKENNIQQTLWWCLDQLPLDVGGQMDRWTDGETWFTALQTTVGGPLSSLLPHMPQTIDSQNLKNSEKWDQKNGKHSQFKTHNFFFVKTWEELLNNQWC